MYELPIRIAINDQEYKITNNGDYRMVIDCFFALNDLELTKEYRIYTSLIIFYEDINSIDDILIKFGDNIDIAVQKMFDFFSCGNSGHKTHYKLLDWEQDEQMICSAINNVANTEIRAVPYLHWFTFIGYFMSIGEGTFSTIVSIRDKIMRGKKLEKYEREFKQNNPEYFMWSNKTTEQLELEKELLANWNTSK